MTIGVLFWILMLFLLLYGLWTGRTPTGIDIRMPVVIVIIVVLLGLLGWHSFGAPIR